VGFKGPGEFVLLVLFSFFSADIRPLSPRVLLYEREPPLGVVFFAGRFFGPFSPSSPHLRFHPFPFLLGMSFSRQRFSLIRQAALPLPTPLGGFFLFLFLRLWFPALLSDSPPSRPSELSKIDDFRGTPSIGLPFPRVSPPPRFPEQHHFRSGFYRRGSTLRDSTI